MNRTVIGVVAGHECSHVVSVAARSIARTGWEGCRSRLPGHVVRHSVTPVERDVAGRDRVWRRRKRRVCDRDRRRMTARRRRGRWGRGRRRRRITIARTVAARCRYRNRRNRQPTRHEHDASMWRLPGLNLPRWPRVRLWIYATGSRESHRSSLREWCSDTYSRRPLTESRSWRRRPLDCRTRLGAALVLSATSRCVSQRHPSGT